MNGGLSKPSGTRRGFSRRFFLQATGSFAGLLWVFYALRRVDWRTSLAGLAGLDAGLLAGCLLLVVLIYASRLIRLRLWTDGLTATRLSGPVWIDLYLKSVALGSVTPARLGDFSRIALLSATGLDPARRTRLVLQDKLADFLYIPLAVCLTAGTVAERLTVPAGGLLVVGLVTGVAYLALAGRFGRFLGLPALLTGWGITAVGFLMFITANILLFRAVGIRLSFLEVTAIVVSAGALASLPVSIGGLGVREGSLLGLLSLWQVDLAAVPPLLLLELLVNMFFPLLLYFCWLGCRVAVQRMGR